MREKLGKYELVRRIGGGSYGLVYEAFDPHLKRPVAIKVCTSREETARQRFHREAEIAGNLVHPNITTVHDFGFHGDVPYLVEEFLEGEDLDDRIRRREPLSLSQQLDYLVQAAAGLGYAHLQGIVHRDIKPSNLRILADDSAKILDFGTAKRAESESQLTQSGTTVGTAAYLSPEILRGDEATARSDTFSFGVMAYELLSGGRPFPGLQIAEVLSQILHEEPAPLRVIWPECPVDLDQVVARCLSKDVDGRYQNCSQVAEDLERCVVNLYGPGSPSRRPRPIPRRPPELGEDAWLKLLHERARDLARARELPRTLAVLATAQGTSADDPETERLLEQVHQRVQRRARTGLPSDRYEAQSEDRVDQALTELRAVLYIGNIAGVEEVIRRHRDDFSAPESVRRLQKEISGRLVGIRAAIEAAAQATIDDATGTAKSLVAEQRHRPAAQLLRAIQPLDTRNEVESLLHVVTATQRSSGRDQRSAEVLASIGGLINQGRPVEAAAAVRFALGRYGGNVDLGSVLDDLVECFRDEAVRLETAAEGLTARVLEQCREEPTEGTTDRLRHLLQLALELHPDRGPIQDELARLARRDGGEPMRALLDSARNAATDEDWATALDALLAAYRLAPENPRILELLKLSASPLAAPPDDD